MQSKNELNITLSRLQGFVKPDTRLEQYPTPSGIAADLLWDAYQAGHIDGKQVLDLGAGTGILGIGALLLGARSVIFIEKETAALAVLHQNLRTVEGIQPIMDRVKVVPKDLQMTDEAADTVLMNPPFGTRTEHADQRFLEYAIAHAPVVYSFHKASTRDFLHQRIAQLGARIQSEMSVTFPLANAMEHHTRPIAQIAVIRLVITREA